MTSFSVRYFFEVVPGEKFTYYTEEKEQEEENSESDDYISNEPFIKNCPNGDVDDLKDRYDLNLIHKDDIDKAFWESCEYGNLEVAKWLYDSGKIDFSYADADFQGVCRMGQLKVAQWLHSLGYFEDALHSSLWSCGEENHLEVFKWLCSLGIMDVSESKYYANYPFGSGFSEEIDDWILSLPDDESTNIEK